MSFSPCRQIRSRFGCGRALAPGSIDFAILAKITGIAFSLDTRFHLTPPIVLGLQIPPPAISLARIVCRRVIWMLGDKFLSSLLFGHASVGKPNFGSFASGPHGIENVAAQRLFVSK